MRSATDAVWFLPCVVAGMFLWGQRVFEVSFVCYSVNSFGLRILSRMS